ncbi:hypothetical protein [Deinococcus marmoris]|uniref:Uncharacterized protein n=1 Tax=Deinococcus marmoris TaxID=249408 RepID=A0A1U7P4G0_9DEIO|nr:hypothetical protein [Deinococcus marmoris]OLV20052.1 hypothetical protein BOO71_0000757 [Deinococcus marmoris]
MGVYYNVLGVIASGRRDQVKADLKDLLADDLTGDRPFRLDFSADTLQSIDIEDNESQISESVWIRFYPQVQGSLYQFFSVETPALFTKHIQTSSALIERLRAVADVARPLVMKSVITDYTPDIIQTGSIQKLMESCGGIIYFSDVFAYDLTELKSFEDHPFAYRIYHQESGWLCVRPNGAGNESCYVFDNRGHRNVKWRQINDAGLDILHSSLIQTYDRQMAPVLEKIRQRISALPPNS